MEANNSQEDNNKHLKYEAFLKLYNEFSSEKITRIMIGHGIKFSETKVNKDEGTITAFGKRSKDGAEVKYIFTAPEELTDQYEDNEQGDSLGESNKERGLSEFITYIDFNDLSDFFNNRLKFYRNDGVTIEIVVTSNEEKNI